MIKLIEETPVIQTDKIKKMSEMKPLEVCVTVDASAVVFRTASSDHFEVIDMSNVGVDECWVDNYSFSPKVRELREGESYTFELS